MNKVIYKENTINYIKDFIIKKKVSMENSDRNPDYSQINKICFFLCNGEFISTNN